MLFQFSAWAEYLYWQDRDKRVLKRINDLLQDVARQGYAGIGKPELLKGDLSGFWSRRIDEKNRLFYRLVGEICEIIQCRDHYG